MINKEKLIEGAIFWCILGSSEAEDYGNTKPCKPWQGKLRIEKQPGGISYSLSCFYKYTGEIDDDSNATALLGTHPESNLFETEVEAQKSFIRAFFDYCEQSANQMSQDLRELVDYMVYYMEIIRQVELPK